MVSLSQIIDDLVDVAENELSPPLSPIGGRGLFPFTKVIREGEEPITPLRDDPLFGPIARAVEEATGRDIQDLSSSELRDRFINDQATRRAILEAIERAEQDTMVDYPTFVSIFSQKCGGGAQEAAPVWNRHKEQIKQMTVSEVRAELNCP